MDLIDKITEIAKRIPGQLDQIKTEEATKNALVMPVISALGYDVFNPAEVIPEYTVDVGTKKGEKVDYAIKKGNETIILIECKKAKDSLDTAHTTQLFRYFAVTEARFAILTNGLIYQFYSDIEAANKMDTKPFFTFNILDFQRQEVEELSKFTKETFSLNAILSTARTLKYTGAIKKLLDEALVDPSEDFVRFFASQVFDGRLTKQVMESFSGIVKEARKQFINEKINARLNSALTAGDKAEEPVGETFSSLHPREGIFTTEEEIEGYNIVKAILRTEIDSKRIVIRDNKSYCAILLDNSNRKTLCRLYFDTAQKYLGIIKGKEVTRLKIDSVDDIFKHTDLLKATLVSYESAASGKDSEDLEDPTHTQESLQ